MWAVFKIEKKNLNFFKSEIKKKTFCENIKYYYPKIQIQFLKNNSLKNKTINILGNYIFCFHQNFNDINFVKSISGTKGLKYILKGFQGSQKDISEFIKKCKSLENESGIISKNFFDLKILKDYKFSSGPFINKIFQIIKIENNLININLGRLNTTLHKDKYFFNPI